MFHAILASSFVGVIMSDLGLTPTFLYPMYRAAVLHAQSYNINATWKNTPGENELVLSCEIFTFRPKKYT